MKPQELVSNHVIYNQSSIVEELIKSRAIPQEEIYPIYEADEDVMEWWLVTPYMARLLRNESEIVLENLGCHWWGRTSTGQAIYLDYVIGEICKPF